MNSIFKRNYVIFSALVMICAGAFSYALLRGEHDLGKTDDMVRHTHQVIIAGEELSALVVTMLAAQRGYLLTGDEKFWDRYSKAKEGVSENIALLSELTKDNPSQQSRLSELRNHFAVFYSQLEERAKQLTTQEILKNLSNVEIIQREQETIANINKNLLQEEYALMNLRFAKLEAQKGKYFSALLGGVIVCAILLLLFNAYLFHAQYRRSLIEEQLEDTEARFKLAADGTNDGVFDWNLKTGDIFYSRQCFGLLGYERAGFTGRTEDLDELLHPEDSARVAAYIEEYLSGKLSEYDQTFRLKHKEGHYVWIRSRAKGIFDSNDNCVRLVGAHSDVTHIKLEQKKLEQEKKEAEEANRAKSDFLAHMSHEIRTPLTSISGIAEILQKEKGGLDQKLQTLIQTLSSSTSNLKDLINDILDFSRIESGELKLDEASFSIREMMQSIISMMAVKANEKGVSFVFDYDDLKFDYFYGDQIRLRQIIVNLVANAIKFTDEGGVTVKVYEEDRGDVGILRIDVSDTGIGIDTQNFDLIFERFKQADESVSRRFGGTGLGLPISRKLATLMGGDIVVSSQIGKGSTFSLLIPSKVVEDTDGADEKEYAHKSKKISEKIRSEVTGEQRLLLVEDYEGNIVMLSYLLDDLGLKYNVAKTGLEALDLWNEHHFNVILMDIQMPEMDGFTATQKIRELEKERDLARTPIIGMTAHALVGDEDKCIAAGMDAYLSKPVVEADLKEKIYQYISSKKKAA